MILSWIMIQCIFNECNMFSARWSCQHARALILKYFQSIRFILSLTLPGCHIMLTWAAIWQFRPNSSISCQVDQFYWRLFFHLLQVRQVGFPLAAPSSLAFYIACSYQVFHLFLAHDVSEKLHLPVYHFT